MRARTHRAPLGACSYSSGAPAGASCGAPPSWRASSMGALGTPSSCAAPSPSPSPPLLLLLGAAGCMLLGSAERRTACWVCTRDWDGTAAGARGDGHALGAGAGGGSGVGGASDMLPSTSASASVSPSDGTASASGAPSWGREPFRRSRRLGLASAALLATEASFASPRSASPSLPPQCVPGRAHSTASSPASGSRAHGAVAAGARSSTLWVISRPCVSHAEVVAAGWGCVSVFDGALSPLAAALSPTRRRRRSGARGGVAPCTSASSGGRAGSMRSGSLFSCAASSEGDTTLVASCWLQAPVP
jgi:hypothetical protein